MPHLLFLLLCLPSTAGVFVQDQKAPQPPVTFHRNLVYGKGGDQELKLDLAIPEGKGPFPLIVFVHGGGWKGGSYKDSIMQMVMTKFAKQGYAGACIGYRLTPSKARFPSQIEDCKCAVRWLRGHASQYGFDPERIGALGGSAGGHLVLLLGLTSQEDGLEGKGDLKDDFAKLSSQVHAVVNLFGPSDLVNGDWDKGVEPLVVDLLGGPVAEKTDLAKQASPLTYVRQKTSPPPILTFHGTKDRIVPYIHATKLHTALEKIRAGAKLVTMEGEGHGWGGEKLEKTLKLTEEFFAEHLKNKKKQE